MEILEIYWRDSKMFIEQCSDKENFSVCDICSVGFVIKKTNREIVLSGDLIEDEFRRVIVIPKENIVNIYKLSNRKLCSQKKK